MSMNYSRRMPQHKHCNRVGGFTLIETLVAITLLMIAIVGPFYALQSGLLASYSSRDQLIASSLAQEGLEYVRNVRDDNFLSGNEWLYNLDGSGTHTANCVTPLASANNPTKCTVDVPQDATSVCASGNCPVLKLYSSSSAYYYTYTSGSNTQYTRTVEIIQVNNNGDASREVRVIVTVSWNSHGPHSITVTDYIENWL